MAFLKVIKGSCPGQIVPLQGERMVVGRHPSCEIVVDNAAVSRHHARILESLGHYYLEDLRSRNGTYLNGVAVDGRVELHEADAGKVCDVVFRFHEQMPPSDDEVSDSTLSWHEDDVGAGGPRIANSATVLDRKRNALVIGDEAEESFSDKSSIITTLNAGSGSGLRYSVKPEAKLRAVMEISNMLGRVLTLEEVLPKILDGLFNIFPQADEGFILLLDPEKKKLVLKASKSRGGEKEDTVQISMTIVNQAMKSGNGILSADAVEDSRFDTSESLTDLQIRSMMCVPLVGKAEKSLGVLQLDTKHLGQQFGQDDLDVLVSVAAQATLAVENASLHEEVLKQRDLERDLEFATHVQLGFLPNERPKLAGYEFYDFYEAALRVGGDYFDYVVLPDQRVAVAVADVAGKGVPAALLMARLHASARYQLFTRLSAAAALTGLNAEVASSGLGHRFVTFILAILDPRTHELTIANAGHLPPLLRGADGKVRRIAHAESGMPLGITPDQEFQEVTFKLQSGDTYVFFTDGITESMSPKSEIYGSRRLSRFIAKAPTGVDELVKGIVADVENFCQGRPQRDDMCLVGLRRLS